MERDVRHPSLFTLCGLVLCLMFMGNLAKAEEPLAIYLNMSDFTNEQYRGFMQVYDEPLDQTSEALLRVYPGAIRMMDVEPGEWVAINVAMISTIFPCKNNQDEHRIEVGTGSLTQSVIITPRLAVEGNSSVCRLEIVAADSGE
ncbi:hypothetical protein M3P05_12315 [Sansalvadorimonas sp. 2012CJ34-2]|uniref:Uncharacterized protein n=1 Tax=Parendozoicomonas callyspongiae TaxID=2942213 RepID=A0ABT0PH52_9GAMM|nr:hypothetical protein [Sansalvadorimonas sp. 2012CJ34-2]MCL6270708.1 hypothetical protein [Sansalvadorimonas sp. 2012CJ34-2]